MKPLLPLLPLLSVGLLNAAPQPETSLSPILMFVADAASADAAAPRIQHIIESKGAAQLKVDPYDLLLLRCTACFGSEALQKVMRPFIPAPTEEEKAFVQPYLVHLTEMWQAMDDLALSLNNVQDKASADAAAEQLFSFAPFISSCAEKLAALESPEEHAVARELRLRYFTGTRHHTAVFLQAWGALAQRNAEYYDSSRLLEGLLTVRDVLENMGMQVEPDAIPRVVEASAKLRPLLRQWIALLALVQDKDSADAVAAQFQRLRVQMSEVSRNAGLSRSFEEDLFLYSPELEVLVHIMDRVTHYLQEEVKPPCYGSSRLSEALEHED